MRYILAEGPHYGFSGVPNPIAKYIYKELTPDFSNTWSIGWFSTSEGWKKSSYVTGVCYSEEEIGQHHGNVRVIDDAELFEIML